MNKLIALIILFALTSINLFAQESNNEETDIKSNGIVISESNTEDDKYEIKNVNENKYFLSSSAIPLKKKQFQYQNVMLISNQVKVGITDEFSVGTGFDLFSLISNEPVLNFSTKYARQISNKIYLGVGTFSIGEIGVKRDNQDTAFRHFLNGTITFGTSNTSLSLGGFVGLNKRNKNSYKEEQYVAFTLSANHRISDRLMIISENYFYTDYPNNFLWNNSYVGNHGIRIMGKIISVDLGISAFTIKSDLFSFGALPVAGFILNF